MFTCSRRGFLVGVPATCVIGLGAGPGGARRADASPDVPDAFPSQDPKMVEEVVRRSHFDLEGVRALVEPRPSLARAAWDWGFGDWETALGAASHMGRRDIAELLMSHGARPDLFTFAMLGHLDAVRAVIEAQPGIQRTTGPHGITLLAHARNGGEPAQAVVAYLESLGDADDAQRSEQIDEAQEQRLLGRYKFGDGAEDFFEIVKMRDGLLGIRRGQRVPRHLFHLGDHAFHPTAATHARVSFRLAADGSVDALTVHDADIILTARRAP